MSEEFKNPQSRAAVTLALASALLRADGKNLVASGMGSTQAKKEEIVAAFKEATTLVNDVIGA